MSSRNKPLIIVLIAIQAFWSCVTLAAKDNMQTFEMLRGNSGFLPLYRLTESAPDSGNIEIKIVSAPQEGVIKTTPVQECQPGFVCLEYRHGGTSITPDRFVYQVFKGDVELTASRVAEISFLTAQAMVRITSPENGATIEGDSLHVRYELAGDDFDHLHLSLNGKGHNTIRNLTGQYTFENVPPGRHVISAQLVDANHQSVRVRTASHEISVNVRAR